MIPSLMYLPAPTPTSRLIIQVPTVTPVGEKFALSSTLAALNPSLSVLPETFTVILSATPQESVDLAAAAYKLPTHAIHLFDHHSSAREHGELHVPATPAKGAVGASVRDVLSEAGYDFFDYSGAEDAETVLVALNGPLSLAAKAIAKRTSGLGVLSVRVLRPWDEAAFKAVLPSSVKRIQVLDDVANGGQGFLHFSVLSTLFDPTGAGPAIYTQPISPANALEYANKPASFIQFLSSFIPVVLPSGPSLDAPKTTKLLFFNSPGAALSNVSQLVQNTFAEASSISARLLTEHDVFSRAGGVTVDRILLAPKDSVADFVPLPTALPVTPGSEGVSNFLAVLDHNLLKSHSVLEHAKPGSPVLVATSWTAPELISNLHWDVVALIKERGLRFCIINTKEVATQLLGEGASTLDNLQSVVVHLAFLRLYLGQAATQAAVEKVARTIYGENVQTVDLSKVNAHAWAALAEVDFSTATESSDDTRELEMKHFEFNAIAVSTDDGETIVNGAKLVSWHDAAKHLMFSNAFTPPAPEAAAGEEFPQIPNLRPDLPDRTYLVTCTVNRRLTPLEYDRNVFHLEFDTSGTGLKYSIGEALGIHGWNDEQEVLDFCSWYGVDPNRLITIPVLGLDTQYHTRTVFQAMQQQIDLFGKPPKSFYADLSEHAALKTDKLALQFIGAPEGNSTFKKLSEKDTVTFADVLKRYASARPGIEVLCELIGDIKPRHYSIASAQSVVGDRVDLLIVSVDWVTPSGMLYLLFELYSRLILFHIQALLATVSVHVTFPASRLARRSLSLSSLVS